MYVSYTKLCRKPNRNDDKTLTKRICLAKMLEE